MFGFVWALYGFYTVYDIKPKENCGCVAKNMIQYVQYYVVLKLCELRTKD
jgi:hypothetical protein